MFHITRFLILRKCRTIQPKSPVFQIARFKRGAGWGSVALINLAFALFLNCNGAMAAYRSIIDAGAIPDGKTLNTRAIQSTVDKLASNGGGTVVVPAGQFLTGALFIKPKVNLKILAGGVLVGSTNIEDYPPMPTRIEGHTQVWRPALLNASGCDGLRITGRGFIQGGGKPFWDAFWKARSANPKTRNLDVDRPRNLFIEDSKKVVIRGISLRDSGFWNIHLYRCKGVTIDRVDIRTPEHSPSTDGIDVDSCQNVTIRRCHISVDDDNIALKGSKGPLADRDSGSPAVEHVRISDCTFGLGNGILTLGSEACHVRDVVVENCKIEGNETNRVLTIKLRPDTPQHYEDIHVRDITINCPGSLISIEAWKQYFDLAGHAAPSQMVDNVTVSNVTGKTTSFGRIDGPAKSVVRNITLENINLQLRRPRVVIKDVENLKVENMMINGRPWTPGQSTTRGQSRNRRQVAAVSSQPSPGIVSLGPKGPNP
jgi:alpha-L-rhamnosidase